jgi:hypothetical protein
MNALSHPRLPLKIEDIDAEWMTAALRTRFQEVKVNGVQVVDVRNGTCTKIRLRLDLDEAAKRAGIPELMIFKGGFEPHSRDMGYMLHFEVRGYQEVLPELGLPSPKCYFAEYDAEARQSAILMEDLVDSGVSFCNPLKGWTFEETARRLEVLAAFHAKTWTTREKLAAGRWGHLDEMMSSIRGYAEAWTEPETWKRFVDSPRGAATSVRFHDAAWMLDALSRLVVLGDRVPHVVIDGDTHPGNLYVTADGQPGFYDAVPHRGPPMTEIAYTLSCGLDVLDRPRWERALIGGYLDALKRHGIDAPHIDDAMFEYGAHLARAYFVFIINESFFQPEAINTAYVARITAAMVDHDTLGLLQQIV